MSRAITGCFCADSCCRLECLLFQKAVSVFLSEMLSSFAGIFLAGLQEFCLAKVDVERVVAQAVIGW